MSAYTEWMRKTTTYRVLLIMRQAERRTGQNFSWRTSALAAYTGVSATHIANLYKRGYLVKLNPKRHPNEEFRYALADKYRPGVA